jgi:triosephosphate isomerase
MISGRVYLGGKIEPEVAVVLQAVLHEEGYLVGQAELDLIGQAASFAEVHEVL